MKLSIAFRWADSGPLTGPWSDLQPKAALSSSSFRPSLSHARAHTSLIHTWLPQEFCSVAMFLAASASSSSGSQRSLSFSLSLSAFMNVYVSLGFCFNFRSTNRRAHSTRYSAWASSSRTRQTSSTSLGTTPKAGRKSLFPRTSSATTASALLRYYQRLPGTLLTKGSRWTASGSVRIFSGWKAVASSRSMVRFKLCYRINLIFKRLAANFD